VGAIPSAVTAVTQPPGNNTTKIATTAFVQAALSALYPLGSIYINAVDNRNPSILLGFGTWVAFGAGNVPVGFDTANPLFNAGEKQYGFADSPIVTHSHTATFSGSALGNHSHGASFSGGALPNHQHDSSWGESISAVPVASTPFGVSGRTGRGSGSTDNDNQGWLTSPNLYNAGSISGTVSVNGASAGSPGGSVSVANATSGIAGTNRNYQPSITVFMWKRTG
jgi:hypothetical protein